MAPISAKQLNMGLKILNSNINSKAFPYKLNFATTYWCNSKCNHCSIWKKRPKNEMTLDEIRSFAQNNGFFSWVNMTGGEPFLRRDITGIAQAFAENSRNLYLMNITTNCFNPDYIVSKVRELLSLKIPRFITVVSLDGDKETYKEVRGVDWYDKVIETYKALKALAGEHNRFDAFFGYTINPFNQGKFNRTFAALKDSVPGIRAADVHVNIFHTSQHYYDNMSPKTDYELYKKSVLAELEEIEKIKQSNVLSPIGFLEERYVHFAKQYIATGKTPMTCKALSTSVFVDPWGNVFPCTIYGRILGNLRKNDFSLQKILFSEFSNQTKREINELKCPNCWTPCEAYQMMLANMGKTIKP
ncbi:MAG: radical SAM protein [Candidatus Aenigmarchaeota archaeon]|nr:radical SAM protein [Candidatus Aenigmarchaeota archaeon]